MDVCRWLLQFYPEAAVAGTRSASPESGFTHKCDIEAPWLTQVSNAGAARSGGRAGRVAADGGSGFEAVFLDPVGQAVQQRWADAAMTVAFEELPPVSAFPAVPGRRWGPGLWWSATTGRHVVAGSNAMRTQLMVLDRDPLFRVEALAFIIAVFLMVLHIP